MRRGGLGPGPAGSIEGSGSFAGLPEQADLTFPAGVLPAPLQTGRIYYSEPIHCCNTCSPSQHPTMSSPCPASNCPLLQIDYVRVYQDPEAINLGCSPPDYPTAQWIAWWVGCQRGMQYYEGVPFEDLLWGGCGQAWMPVAPAPPPPAAPPPPPPPRGLTRCTSSSVLHTLQG